MQHENNGNSNFDSKELNFIMILPQIPDELWVSISYQMFPGSVHDIQLGKCSEWTGPKMKFMEPCEWNWIDTRLRSSKTD